MFLFNDCVVLFNISLTYMLFYNVAVFLLFATLMQVNVSVMQTTYSLASLSNLNSASKTMIISFFSMAGVPPFVGFFAKVLVFVNLTNSNFFILYMFFFPLVFFGLYFYVQNIRFLNSSKVLTTPSTHVPQLRSLVSINYLIVTSLFVLIFGMFYVDDVYFYTLWLVA